MPKKFYILLLAMVVLAGILFFWQIKRASQITTQREAAPLISPQAIFIPDSASEQSLGNPGASIIITEFMDIGCSRCLAMHSVMKEFTLKHPQDIRLVWKDNIKPGILADYTLAHQAAFCAGLQNKFWSFIDMAAKNRNNLKEPGLKKIAQELGLDVESWWQCVNSPETQQAIADSGQLANQLGIRSLPAIFVNNKLINTDKDINMEEMLTNFIKKPSP